MGAGHVAAWSLTPAANLDVNQQLLQNQELAFVTTFARTGNPTGEGTPAWPRFHFADAAADRAMGVLAAAVEKHDRRTRHLWFDVASVATHIAPADVPRVVKRIRQVGVERVLFGSDAAVEGNLPPREAWASFRKLPLSEAELDHIARNLAPYLR